MLKKKPPKKKPNRAAAGRGKARPEAVQSSQDARPAKPALPGDARAGAVRARAPRGTESRLADPIAHAPAAVPVDTESGSEPAAGPFRAGIVAVVGRPNVGKSTLVNRMVGQKVAIVTPRPQTTRNRILGIVNRPGAQVVLVDTPGLHRPDSVMGKQMMDELAQALEGVDAVAVMIDASEGITRADRFAFERLREVTAPVFLLLNKIDRMSKTALLPLLQSALKEREFAEMIPISALSGDGVELALREIIARLPEGEPLYPTDQFTDQPERFLAAEIIREKAMTATRQEVPQALAVEVESFEEVGERLIRIRALLQVEREGQKGILIGRGGEMMKRIGTEARLELEQVLGKKIFLQLYVKVSRDWRDDPRRVARLDWRRQIENLGGTDNDAPE